MTNEEMQRILEYMIQRQEAFTEQQERFRVDMERLEQNTEKLQVHLNGLNVTVREIGDKQLKTQRAMTRAQVDLSHLTKIVTGLVETVARERDGDSSRT